LDDQLLEVLCDGLRTGHDIETANLEEAFAHAALEGNIDPESLQPDQFKDYFDNPSSFQEAWNHPDPFQRAKWRDAINKEFTKMEALKVWKKIKRADMPGNRRCVKHKWVFEIKRNGIFRARLVACGYSQIPGVDFDQIYSPVVNDVTVRLLLVVLLIYEL
jgi:hypothetical protein